VLDASQNIIVKTTSSDMAVLFICTNRMPFLAPTLDNAAPLFALVIKTKLLSAQSRGGSSKRL